MKANGSPSSSLPERQHVTHEEEEEEEDNEDTEVEEGGAQQQLRLLLFALCSCTCCAFVTRGAGMARSRPTTENLEQILVD